MTKHLKVFIFLASYTTLQISLAQGQVDLAEAPTVDQPFEFKIVPGTPEWVKVFDSIGPWEACQIPRELAQKMTTSALAKTCLKYPMRADIIAFSFSGSGIDIMRQRFNGLDELLRRKDAGTHLLALFNEMDTAGVAGGPPNKQGTTFGDLAFLIPIISQTFVLNTLSEAEEQSLLSVAFRQMHAVREAAQERSVSETLIAELAVKLLVERNVVLRKSDGGTIDKSILNEDELTTWRTFQGISIATIDRLQGLAAAARK